MKAKIFTSILIFSHLLFAQATSDKEQKKTEALELGGIVTVDYFGDKTEQTLGTGTVELSANVNVASNVKASISLLSKENLDSIITDAALVEWSLDQAPLSIIFGQQDLGHGLVSTHLISDPTLLDIGAKLVGPGVIVNSKFGFISPTLGVTYLKRTFEEGHTSDPYFVGLAGYNLNLSNNLLFRNTFSFREDFIDMVAGGSINLNSFTLDMEGYFDLNGYIESPMGIYTGLAYELNEHLEIAARYDDITSDQFDHSEKRVGLGAIVSFEHGIYCAVEYGKLLPSIGKQSDEISIQLGLESTIKLPGFKRKTLTNR